MLETIMPAFIRFPQEATIIGRLLAAGAQALARRRAWSGAGEPTGSMEGARRMRLTWRTACSSRTELGVVSLSASGVATFFGFHNSAPL